VKWRKRSAARWRWGGPGVLVGLTVVAVLSAACSSPPQSRSIASLPSSGGSTTTTPTLSKAQQIAHDDRANVDFARCMRTHGVNVPDPVHVVGHPGAVIRGPRSKRPPTGAAFDACSHFLRSSGWGRADRADRRSPRRNSRRLQAMPAACAPTTSQCPTPTSTATSTSGMCQG